MCVQAKLVPATLHDQPFSASAAPEERSLRSVHISTQRVQQRRAQL
jgi:hypothetical protein